MCLNPKKAFLLSYNDNGLVKNKVIFGKLKNNDIESKEITLRCGRCYECQNEYSNNWSFRCMLESSLYEQNCFITLTFAETNGVLEKRPLQLFIKRLRESIYPKKIRYFACGEYGSKNSRPHYHIIIFGYDFDDKVIFNKKEGLFRSNKLEKLWKFGFSTIGNVNIASCRYVAKYMQKLDKNQKQGFVCMSLKPGIGLGAIEKKNQSAIMYFDGKRYFMPRYFVDYLNKNGYVVDKSAMYEIMEFQKDRNLEQIIKNYGAKGLINLF